jgi:hypothetical protein
MLDEPQTMFETPIDSRVFLVISGVESIKLKPQHLIVRLRLEA